MDSSLVSVSQYNIVPKITLIHIVENSEENKVHKSIFLSSQVGYLSATSRPAKKHHIDEKQNRIHHRESRDTARNPFRTHPHSLVSHIRKYTRAVNIATLSSRTFFLSFSF